MEDFKNCHYDPKSDNPPKPRRGWWWVLALIVTLCVIVVWIKWPTQTDTSKVTEALIVKESSDSEVSAAEKAAPAVKPEVVEQAAAVNEKGTPEETPITPSKALAESKTNQGNTKQTAPAEPEYEFYTLLQKQEVIIPEEELEKHRPEAPTLKPGVYVLQVGSFRTQPQAARSRARLAKHSLEASIQQVTTKDDKVWFRVRIGPYIDPDELRATRETLIDLKIDSIPIRLR